MKGGSELFLAPTGAQEMPNFIRSSICPSKPILSEGLNLSIFIVLAQTNFKSTQIALSKHLESNQAESYHQST